ncbi:hypothetical protein KR009_011580 [Drosophila setifemur]|nr:hypothetical protein KR009_011580 [Drosophila setifemur]
MKSRIVSKWLSHNVAFAGSHATKGYGFGVAIACGQDSDIGTMTQRSFQKRPQGRVAKHNKQSLQLALYTIGVVCFVIFLMLCTFSTDYMIMRLDSLLCLLIALLPLCLPSLLFWGLFKTKMRMGTSQCYVRNLQAVSTVGLTTVIVTDMSGSMCKRSMRVTEVFVDMTLMRPGDRHMRTAGPRFLELIRASLLCNDAAISPGQIGVPKEKKMMYGSNIDVALLRFGLLFVPNVDQLRRDHEKVANRAYTRSERVQVTVHRTTDAHDRPKMIVLMNGHWDVVLPRCSTYAMEENEVAIDEKLVEVIANLADSLMKAGRHVRLFAYKEVSRGVEVRRFSQLITGLEGAGKFRDYLALDTFGMRLLGLIATQNPARSTIKKAVAKCRSAGIKIVVVTKKKPHLAKALAREVGILLPTGDDEHSPHVFDLDLLVKDTLHHQSWLIEQMLLAHRDMVFARSTVDEHYKIVEACHRFGGVVTVIGGTIHDTAILQQAHVGAAKFGCSTTCEAGADIILLDCSFASLVNVITLSRLLFENLKKACAYCLATNTTFILAFLAFYFLEIPIRFQVIAVVIVQCLINFVPAVTLITELPEERLVMQKPKIYDDYLLNRRLFFVSHILVGSIEAAACFIMYFKIMANRGFLPRTLVGLNFKYHDPMVNDLTDSFGQEWSYAARRHLNNKTNNACLMILTMMQCINLLLTKTGRANLLSHGFVGNWVMLLACVYLICICLLLSNLDSALGLHMSEFKQPVLFLTTISPFGILLVVLETARRMFLRRYPDSWLEAETWY